MEEIFISHGEDAPSGENLEYAPEFGEMMLAAQSSEDQQMGDSVVAGADFDPRAVREKALVVLQQSHDLRAAILLARSELILGGFPGLAEALRYIRFCLEDHWDTCHPELDADDDDDPTMRVNSVLDLTDRDTILRSVRSTPLSKSQTFGGISIRDMLVADGELPPAEESEPKSASTIDAAFRDTDPQVLADIYAGVEAARTEIATINAIFDERIPGSGPALDPLTKELLLASRRLAKEVGVDESDDTEEREEGEAAPGGAAPQQRSAPGEVHSPADAEKALDAIIRYYERNEPSSPLPIILYRAKKLVGADFMTIVNDLAPDGVTNVRLVGGIEEEE